MEARGRMTEETTAGSNALEHVPPPRRHPVQYSGDLESSTGGDMRKDMRIFVSTVNGSMKARTGVFRLR